MHTKRRLRQGTEFDELRFGFMPRKGTLDASLDLCQEKFGFMPGKGTLDASFGFMPGKDLYLEKIYSSLDLCQEKI